MNGARGRKIRPAGGSSVLKGSIGEGLDGWAPCGGRAGEREGERWARQWRTAGSARHGTGWLTGGPGRDGGPVISGRVRREAVR
jgi:hypothetical protein